MLRYKYEVPETILTDQETGFFSKIFIKVKKKK